LQITLYSPEGANGSEFCFSISSLLRLYLQVNSGLKRLKYITELFLILNINNVIIRYIASPVICLAFAFPVYFMFMVREPDLWGSDFAF